MSHAVGTGAPEKLDNAGVVSILNGLIETNKDAQDGFTAAAGAVEHTDLKALFHELGQERSRFAGDLQSIVNGLGQEPEKSGTFLASLSRGWMDFKASLSSNEAASVLKSCERAEDTAVAAYRSALENPLPANVAETIRAQSIKVKSSHDRVKALRDSFSHETVRSAAN